MNVQHHIKEKEEKRLSETAGSRVSENAGIGARKRGGHRTKRFKISGACKHI